MGSKLPLVPLTLVAAAGCGVDHAAVLVAFDFGDLSIPDDVDEIQLRVWGPDETMESGLGLSYFYGEDFDGDDADELTAALIRSDQDVAGVYVMAQALGPYSGEGADTDEDTGTARRRVSRGVAAALFRFRPGRTERATLAFGSSEGCRDQDGDGALSGVGCDLLGPLDCDDLDAGAHPTFCTQEGDLVACEASREECDRRDTNCDGSDAWYWDQPDAAAEACGFRLPCGVVADFECLDGEWVCPGVPLLPEDDCASRVDSNCDGRLECECAEGEVAAEVCQRCGTSICRGGSFQCEEARDIGVPLGEPCQASACGSGRVACVWNDADRRYELRCEQGGLPAVSVEVCNDGRGHDDDCDGTIDAEDGLSCPYPVDWASWECSDAARAASGSCWRDGEPRDAGYTVCSGPLILALPLPRESARPDPPTEWLKPWVAWLDLPSGCSTDQLQVVAGDDSRYYLSVGVACPAILDEGTTVSFAIEAEGFDITIGASVMGPEGCDADPEDCGVYDDGFIEPFHVQVPIGNWGSGVGEDEVLLMCGRNEG